MKMIVFDHVTITYKSSDEPTLKDVSFSVDKGEFVMLVGQSGAGKTTIAKLLTKEVVPTSGTIFFNEQNLADIKRSQVHLHRRNIGVIYQDYKLLPELTVGENIALALAIAGKPKNEISERLGDLLQLVQLDGKDNYFPGQLSGGEMQRVGIARALTNAPQVLFADEPTGNLDKETGKHIVQILKKINSLGTTVLMATHEDFDFSAHPHQILKVDKGAVKSSKPVTEEKPKSDPQPEPTKPATKKSKKEEPTTEVKETKVEPVPSPTAKVAETPTATETETPTTPEPDNSDTKKI